MNRKKKLSLSETVREAIRALGHVQDVKETMREFDALQYKEPRNYTTHDIVALRTRKMHMSQAVFASVCNAKISTVQKWERGVSKPTPPVYRLFQLIENDALELIHR
ncbi:MAG: hypothetical protein A2268_14990 [Candidatus Raymondbacteria bacterium RifOxyA12_full_50_37]|nr:MAG: hypothetical protein A2268_14990 [Candidatus Raymondbacteria bacterium RifOxyA12_full_50_37]OGJ88534.1 MAG: hypothetical protein A2248_20270 [Candidatus Raymondbacteria bacterium RIFOXYA2_FULL_49_16]OGJ98995.1 MAG: hypothetical protein A2453_10990 [Candidatus Raymondbacteria bacterium RIFOXYC2_FULL_50_21]OGK00631.1 MAG: hypothetical protein A2487_13835 [Candidatus Raymondbacteria bacterium RifOxyC12_full_50_8]OGP41505.1 MAG: hypothetical protein A2324_05800 [Candidatus Raymondbacteria b